MKTKRLILFVILVVIIVLSFFSYWLTYGDSEWRDNQLLSRITSVNNSLALYKKSNGHFPEKLSNIGVNNKYCLMISFYCYDIKYKPFSDKSSYTIASKATYPFIVYYSSAYPFSYAALGFDSTYTGTRKDFPIYLKDAKVFSDPSVWPDLQ